MGFQSDIFVQTALIDLYSKCSTLVSSRQIFDEMPLKSVVSWNSMISAYSNDFRMEESFGLLKQMRVLHLEPSSSTFVSILSGCSGSTWALHQGLSMHCYGIKLGFDSDLLLSNSIMSMYARSNQIHDAHSLFYSLAEKSTVSWTTIIGGYVNIGRVSVAFDIFNQMRQDQVTLDSIVFLNLISGCAQLGRLLIASSVHALVMKSGCDHEDPILNSFINLYAKCGDIISARRIFNLVHEKSVFLWTSMISGYVHCGYPSEALELFNKLLVTTTRPNGVTIATVLSACADLGSLSIGGEVEQYIILNGFESDLHIQTSLINMYCKCGSMEKAKEIFDRVSNRDLAAWSSMINGYAIYGMGEEALSLFEKMLYEEGIKPDAVVYTGVLLACSHSGLVEVGLKYFQSMKWDFGIEPSIEHYSLLADLLGRAGYLNLAVKAVQAMPVQAQAQAWAPLLSACRTHQNIQLGELVAKRLFDLEPQSTNNYILMANMYTSVGKWKEAAALRRLMNDRALVKEPGWSQIDLTIDRLRFMSH